MEERQLQVLSYHEGQHLPHQRLLTSNREINEQGMAEGQLSYFQRLLNGNREINEQDRESFKELLRTNPDLFTGITAIDTQQQSLLHLASANGHIEIVRVLTAARPEMCLAHDRDGANPLHVAAMRGKVEVLEQLLQDYPIAARAWAGNSEKETILHLCVKYNQPRCLKLLLIYFRGDEFVNAKDNTGNTVLHLAVADNRRHEMVQHIMVYGTKIDVNAVNANKETVMDILRRGKEKGMRPDGVDGDMHDFLTKFNAKTAHEAEILDPTEIGEKRNGILIAAALMATLAFEVGVAPPGGVWQDNLPGHKSGKAVMASYYPILYSFFLCYNILGFISSLVTVALMITDMPFKPGRYSRWTFITMSITITSIAITYLISLVAVSPQLKGEPLTRTALAPAASVILLLLLIAIIAGMIKRTNWINRRRLGH